MDNPDTPALARGGMDRVYQYIDYGSLQLEPGRKTSVSVAAFVSERGSVDKAEIITGSDSHLNSAAINAVRRLSFEPATHAGKSVKSKVLLLLTFKGEEKKEPEKKQEEEVVPPPP
jgi:TonB family protein